MQFKLPVIMIKTEANLEILSLSCSNYLSGPCVLCWGIETLPEIKLDSFPVHIKFGVRTEPVMHVEAAPDLPTPLPKLHAEFPSDKCR